MSKEQYISPIAIDLGAKNTGVYFAHYKAGAGSHEIKKRSGKVYTLDKDSYTFLIASRTQKRHQKRGYDRQQMAKRLFRLIWKEHFKLQCCDKVEQAIGFLFNRRGFSYLTEEYDAEALSRFPEKAYQELPDKFKDGLKPDVEKNSDGTYDLTSELQEWSKDKSVLEKKYKMISEKLCAIKKELVFSSRTKKFVRFLKNKDGKEEKNKGLKECSYWVVERWGIPQIKSDSKKSINLIESSRDWCHKTREDVLKKLEKYKEDTSLKEWNFKPEQFDLEKEREALESEKAKAHLHHLAFALFKTKTEIEDGSRHRKEYFREVQKVIESVDQEQTPKYIKDFVRNWEKSGYKKKELKNLICHISNLELKPLRKYFNDPKHKKGDKWLECRLKEKMDNWILREWRVGEKDKDKADRKDYSYKCLKNKWKGKKSVIDFWLNEEPEWTIPPYQDNNNRRPPKCQSLIFNITYLDKCYPEWQNWVKELQSESEDYLNDYKDQLKNLKNKRNNKYFLSDGIRSAGGEKSQSKSKSKMKAIDSQKRGQKHFDARVLQFLFDRVKDKDPFSFNKIYAQVKRIKQYKRDGKDNAEKEKYVEELKKIKKIYEESKIPENLKTDPNFSTDEIFPKGSFLHLVCKYYNLRQKARDGRLFIQPQYRLNKGRGYENTGRFADKKHLLTYCNHKPRQKRYQLWSDLSGLLQVSNDKLEEYVLKQEGQTKDDKLFEWLKSIKGLKTNCDKAAKEQKSRRRFLKSDIQKVYALISNKTSSKGSPSCKEVKEILKGVELKEAFKIYKLCKKAKELSLDLTQSLYDDRRQEKWKTNLKDHPATAVYLLAQIHNIAFKERAGFSKTCSVCSMDNAQRMQVVSGDRARASRLPAIGTRIIDGAVQRMARVVGRAIAEDKWEQIKLQLCNDQKVCIPIITELNQFEFEPAREDLVKDQRQGRRQGKISERKDQDKAFKEKEERIKEANSSSLCPYNGSQIGDKGEIDHIIPRASKWGILNDEANLIWASKDGNKRKSNEELSLKYLDKKYKESIFGMVDDKEIEKWIIEQIDDEKGENFKFGKYHSFIHLTLDEQKAFRHALFLKGHPLRRKVIDAINNRNRTFVNGTQRYFAEVLANTLYKKAKKEKKENLLTFDYFGVDSQANTFGDGIYELRKAYEEADPEIGRYRKDGGMSEQQKPSKQPGRSLNKKDEDTKKQKPYSHLIDAQMAFMLVVDRHKNEGGMRLKIDDKKLYPLNKNTGEIHKDTLWKDISVSDCDFQEEKLERRSPTKDRFKNRPIHRDTMYAEKFLPLLIHKKECKVKFGFDWKNSWEPNKKYQKKLSCLLPFLLNLNSQTKAIDFKKEEFSLESLCEKLKRIFLKNSNEYFYIPIQTRLVHEFYIKKYNTAQGYKEFDLRRELLSEIAYRTEKKEIKKLESKKKEKKNIGAEDVSKQSFNLKNGVTLPVQKEWKRLVKEWKSDRNKFSEQAEEKTKDRKKQRETNRDEEFIRGFFKKKEQRKELHEKVRKVFSLPVKTSQGKILVARRSWQNNKTYQVINDSDPRKKEPKPFMPALIKNKKGEWSFGRLISSSFVSKNTCHIKNEEFHQKEGKTKEGETVRAINPKKWYSIDVEKNLRQQGVKKIEYSAPNVTAYKVRLDFKEPQKVNIEELLKEDLIKPEKKESLIKDFEEKRPSSLGPYTSKERFDSKNGKIKEKLIPIIKEEFE